MAFPQDKPTDRHNFLYNHGVQAQKSLTWLLRILYCIVVFRIYLHVHSSVMRMIYIVGGCNVVCGFFLPFCYCRFFFALWRAENMDPNPDQSRQRLVLVGLSPSQDQPGLKPCS